MSFTVNIEGMPVVCSSPKEVLDLIRGPISPAEKPPQFESRSEFNRRRTAVFLEAICKPGGASATQLARALGLNGSRGLGPLLRTVRRVIKNAGANTDVYTRTRGGDGRKWIGNANAIAAAADLKAKGRET